MSLALLHSSNNEFVYSLFIYIFYQKNFNTFRRFLVGNTQGEMAEFDIKRLSSSAIVHKYKGVIGSIRSIDTHPILPLIASASIDQYIRIHNADTHRQIAKVIFLLMFDLTIF